MKLLKGQASVPLHEPIGLLVNAHLYGISEHLFLLRPMAEKSFLKLKKKSPDLRGTPCYICLLEKAVLFFPIPDVDYEVRISFYPPMKTL